MNRTCPHCGGVIESEACIDTETIRQLEILGQSFAAVRDTLFSLIRVMSEVKGGSKMNINKFASIYRMADEDGNIVENAYIIEPTDLGNRYDLLDVLKLEFDVYGYENLFAEDEEGRMRIEVFDISEPVLLAILDESLLDTEEE